MKILNRFEKKFREEVKEKTETMNWKPIVGTAVALLVVIRLTQKSNSTIVNVYPQKDN